MRVAIMQPYFFPYLGYFQLIGAVDVFVIFDDVNYINRGWINRNYIIGKDKPQRIGVALGKSSQNLLINEIEVVDPCVKLLRSIAQNYRKAPQFNAIFPMIERILLHERRNLAAFLSNSVQVASDVLGIKTRFILSSSLAKDDSLRAEAKILAICNELGADHYINPIGGQSLYSAEPFNRQGLNLSFLQTRNVAYRQFGKTFVPHLSIIDVLMFNDLEHCRRLLAEYDLLLGLRCA